ncbi:UNVERIFIED_CONTAM: hypothetical protein FKN15_018785 [Acipenser sinensis]
MQHQVRWMDEETRSLLQIITDLGVMDKLDRPHQRNATIFTSIPGALAELGINRTLLQVRDKFKKLKYLYLQERKSLQSSGQSSRSQFQFGEEMHRLMGDRPVAVASDHLLESSSSQASCEIPAPSIQYGEDQPGSSTAASCPGPAVSPRPLVDERVPVTDDQQHVGQREEEEEGGGLTERQFRQHLIQEHRLMHLEYRRMYRLIARTAARQDRQYSHFLERLDHADQQHQKVVALHTEFLCTITRELQVPTPAPAEVGTRSAVRSPAESPVREVEQLGRITGPQEEEDCNCN